MKCSALLIVAAGCGIAALGSLAAAEEDAERDEAVGNWREIYLREAKSLELFVIDGA